MSSETYKPHHQRATTLPDAGTFKEAPVSYPRRPATIENSSRDECRLEVSDKDCTLEFSDRLCNLELNQYIDDKDIDKQVEAGVLATGRESTVDGTRDIESESVTGTVQRRKSHRLQWIIAGSVLGVVLLVVIIVPSAIFGTRHAKANKLPADGYTS